MSKRTSASFLPPEPSQRAATAQVTLTDKLGQVLPVGCASVIDSRGIMYGVLFTERSIYERGRGVKVIPVGKDAGRKVAVYMPRTMLIKVTPEELSFTTKEERARLYGRYAAPLREKAREELLARKRPPIE